MTSTANAPAAPKRRPSVVIVGAGFASLNAAHQLRKAPVDITIVDRNNFHTFQPLLYQVSTGYLGPDEVGATVRSIFRRQRNVRFRTGRVLGAHWGRRTIALDDGTDLAFDYLVIGAGATTNFFGVPGMDRHAWPLYTLGDAVRLRNHLLLELERSAAAPGTHPERSTVVVVGGGPTGVEMAGALAAMGRDLIGSDVSLRVILIEALPKLLNNFSEKSSERALGNLRIMGVDVRLDTKVRAADDEWVELEGGERIATHTVVWAAGVRANSLGTDFGLETGKGGTIVVDSGLQVLGRPGVFAAGDIASVRDPVGGKPFPQLAPVAIQGGIHVGRQIERLLGGGSLKPFRYRDKGIMAVIGRGHAVAEIPKPTRLLIGGRLAWLLWLGVHVVYLIGFRNRIKVLIDWGWNYFTSRGGGAILLQVPEKPGPDA